MKPQEIFDTVARHLFKQGHPAVEDGSCLYRASNGDRCAAGVLITDRYYDPKMEGQATLAIAKQFDLPKWFKANQELIEALQYIHDDTYALTNSGKFSRPKLKIELQNTAKYFNLEYKGDYDK